MCFVNAGFPIHIATNKHFLVKGSPRLTAQRSELSMELHHMRYFVAVAEELSFRRAAERLHICQPPLSRQIKALETELSVRLLERNRGSRIVLTDAGRTFLIDSRRVLKSVETARQHAAAASRGVQGRLVIGNYSALSSRLLPACLKRFRNAFPQVEVSIVEMEGPEELTAIYDGRIHVGLFADFALQPPLDFEFKPLLTVPFVAVMPADHPVAKEKAHEIELHHLAGEVLLHQPSQHAPCYTRRLPEICQRAGVTPRALHAVDGLDNLLAMVAAGYGIAILPDVFGGTLRDAFRCKRLCLPMPPYQLCAVWLRGASDPVLKNFLRVASRVAGEEHRSDGSIVLIRRRRREPTT